MPIERRPEAGFTEGARVTHSAAQAIGTGAWATLAFNTERWDTHGLHDNAVNNSRLTCKTAGKYSIKGQARFDLNAAGKRSIMITLNGSTELCHNALLNLGAGTYVSVNVETIYDLAVGDYVELEVYQDSGGDLNVTQRANQTPEFMMQRIG